jgi:hypothetical protein
MPQEIEQSVEFVDENKAEDIKYTFLEQGEEVAPVVEVIAPVEETPAEIVEEAASIIEDDEFEAVELNEDLAIQYLAESKGMTVEEFQNSLTPKEQKKYAPEIEKFQEFVDKTGNHSYKDFEATQKDWKAESQEVVLKELLRSENPLLDKEDIDFLYEDKYVFDDDTDSDREIKSKQINAKVDLQKAHNYLDKQKEDYMVNRGSDEHIPEEYRSAKADWEGLLQQQESTELARQENRNDYLTKIESVFSKDFDGIKVKMGNDEIGYEEVSMKPENLQEIKESILNLDNFNKEFFDEKTGKLNKALDFVQIMIKAKNYDADMNKAYNRGIAKKVELDDKLSKNIQPDNIRTSGESQNAKWTFSAQE